MLKVTPRVSIPLRCVCERKITQRDLKNRVNTHTKHSQIRKPNNHSWGASYPVCMVEKRDRLNYANNNSPGALVKKLCISFALLAK